MTAVESTRSSRRAPWADARFLIGILLIVVSVAGVWVVVAAARQTTPVLAAARTVVPGELLADADLTVVDVALGQAAAAYATADAVLEGSVATRTIRAGELVPAAALGDAADARSTTVVLRSAVDVPASVEAGTLVEIWASPLLERGLYDTPRILVADATVVSVTRDDSMMGGGAATAEVVIPRADVATVLAAISDSAAISVVPTMGSLR